MALTFGRDRLPEPWPTVNGQGLPGDLTLEEIEEEEAMAATADAYAKAFGIECGWDEERQAFVTRLAPPCAACGHERASHTTGAMCIGTGAGCSCVRFPDAPDFAAVQP